MNQGQLIFFISILLGGSLAVLGPCPGAEAQTAEVSVGPGNFPKYLNWEQKANLDFYTQSSKFWHMDLISVPVENVAIDVADDFTASFRKEFMSADGSRVLFPAHPLADLEALNGYPSRSFRQEGKFDQGVVQFTASRSMYYYDGSQKGPLFQVKAPTNHVFNPERPNDYSPYYHYQKSKGEMKSILHIARARTRYFDLTERPDRIDPYLGLLREVASVKFYPRAGFHSKDSQENGFIIRDISPLLSADKAYLPAFSIPFAGGEIAAHNKESFGEFWKKHYAYALGRAKARLLLKYGLQMYSPNPQNILVELDAEGLRPTGKIFLRDVADSRFVDPVMKSINPNCYWFAYDKYKQMTVDKYLHPYWSNSSWRLDYQGKDKLNEKDLLEWGRSHHQGYLDEINSSLGTHIAPLVPLENAERGRSLTYFDMVNINQKGMTLMGDDLDMDEMRYLYPLHQYFTSEEGKKRLGEWGSANEKDRKECLRMAIQGLSKAPNPEMDTGPHKECPSSSI